MQVFPAVHVIDLMSHPKAVGEFSEAVILTRLLELGLAPCLPFGDNQRYDIVFEENGLFIRAQCRTGRLKEGSVRFSTNCVRWAKGWKWKSSTYKGEIDVFLVYCPETKKVYRLSIDDVGVRQVWLRVDVPRNGRLQNIRWAKDYEF